MHPLAHGSEGGWEKEENWGGGKLGRRKGKNRILAMGRNGKPTPAYLEKKEQGGVTPRPFKTKNTDGGEMEKKRGGIKSSRNKHIIRNLGRAD